ncbi:MAG: hypothetical protein Q8934_09690 [Bacillota bacterium]|nr:hypothetical protein [Bacillota bacterium]
MSVNNVLNHLLEDQEKEQETLNLFYSTQTVIKKALEKLGHQNEMHELLKDPLLIFLF